MKRYWLEYHDAAVTELDEIHAFIAAYAGDAVADRKISEIEAAVYRLAEYPKISTPRDEMRPGLRTVMAAEKAVICFLVNDEIATVRIIGFSYAGSDWASRVKDRD